MHREYLVGELQRESRLAAYALVRSIAPTFAEADWHALSDGSRPWRMISVRDVAGRVRGLAVYSLRMHPRAGLLLDVPIFIALSAVGHQEIARSLFTCLIAEASPCHFLRVWNDFPNNLKQMEDTRFFRRWDHGLIYRVPPGEGRSGIAVKT